MKKALFLFNPHAGKGKIVSNIATITDILTKAGYLVTAYPTQDLTSGGTANASTAFPRSSGTGLIDVSGDGQVNFVVNLEQDYRVQSVVVTPTANFKNLKGPSDTGVENGYRVTKMTGAVTITVTATDDPCDHEFDENGFCIHCGIEAPKVVFVTDGGATVTAYPTVFTDQVTIFLPGTQTSSSATVTLCDALGRQVLQQDEILNSQFSIPNLKDLPAGVYFATVSYNDNVTTIKLIKK